jgi:hypothetical protein
LFFRGQLFGALSDRVNEKLLAHWKGHGQSIEEGRAKGIAPVPSGWERRFQVNKEASDDEFGHGDSKELLMCILAQYTSVLFQGSGVQHNWSVRSWRQCAHHSSKGAGS